MSQGPEMEVSEDVKRILEIQKVLNGFASRVRGELGLLAIKNLRPARNGRDLAGRVDLLRSYISCRETRGEWPWIFAVCISPFLSEGRRYGILSGENLASIARFLALARITREHLAKYKDFYAPLLVQMI